MTVWGQVGKNSLCIPDTYFPVPFKKYSARSHLMEMNAGACKFPGRRISDVLASLYSAALVKEARD